MNEKDIEVYLMVNEPVFVWGDKQYSVCYVNEMFCTWDSDGNTFDFQDISSLLDSWIVDGKPFRDVVETIM